MNNTITSFETLSLPLQITFGCLVGWTFFSLYYIFARKHENINPRLAELIPQIFTTIGILGTFVGIAVGLWNFEVSNIEASIPELLKGLKTSFLASIAGIILQIVFSNIIVFRQWRKEKGKQTDETIALNKISELISELKTDFNNNFIYTDENNNKVKPANILHGIYEESRKQSGALQAFSTDLANKVEAGFEKIINTPDKGVVDELKSVKVAIENLGQKLQDPAMDVTNKMVDGIQTTMVKMLEEFKATMSGSTNKELENVAKSLSEAGRLLGGFPTQIQSMTEKMDAVVDKMSEKINARVGDLQVGQEVLIGKQTENLKISENLLSAFNTSIERMNGLSKEVSGTISGFSKVQNELNIASSQLKLIAENVNDSSNSFKEAQLRFSQHSNHFLETNSKTIEQIQATLERAKDVSNEYTQKFTIIEKGLQGIFKQIETGLEEYQKTIGSSIESYLGKYSEALTKTAESLAGASSMQEGILEELTEQLSKFKGR